MKSRKYWINCYDSDYPIAWQSARCVTEFKIAGQDSGNVSFFAYADDPAEMEAALESDPMVIEWEEV